MLFFWAYIGNRYEKIKVTLLSSLANTISFHLERHGEGPLVVVVTSTIVKTFMG